MADDQEEQNQMGEDGGVIDDGANDNGDTADLIGTTAPPVIEEGGDSAFNDFADDDEPMEDYVVKLIINDQPNGVPVTDAIANEYGNVITTTSSSLQDAIDDYTSTITGNGTSIGGKGWWGDWTWHKGLVVGLIALCIIGIIIALIFIILGRRGKKTKSSQKSTGTPEVKGVKKGVTQDPKYSSVPTNV